MARRDEGSARIETIFRPGGNQRFSRETVVSGRVRNNQELALHDGIGAKGELTRSFR